MSGDGNETERPAGLIDVQECTTAFSEYLTEARGDIGRTGWMSELCEKPGDRISVTLSDRARE